METCINLTWDKVDSLCSKIISAIQKDTFSPDVVLTIQRGGFVPSVIISHKLGCRSIKVVNILRTDSDKINSTKTEPYFDSHVDLSSIEEKCVLVIDDIVGSGKTLDFLLQELSKYNPKEVKTAIVIQNDDNFNDKNLSDRFHIDYLGEHVNGWVVFPWEQDLIITK